MATSGSSNRLQAAINNFLAIDVTKTLDHNIIILKKTQYQQIYQYAEQHTLLSLRKILPAVYIQSHYIIEYCAEQHQNNINRLSPCIEINTGKQ